MSVIKDFSRLKRKPAFAPFFDSSPYRAFPALFLAFRSQPPCLVQFHSPLGTGTDAMFKWGKWVWVLLTIVIYLVQAEKNESVSHSVMPVSLQPHGLQATRLLCPWNSPGKNTGVGSLSFLQGIFPTQGLNPGLLHCRHILYRLSRILLHDWATELN